MHLSDFRRGSRLAEGDRGRIATYADDGAATLREFAAAIRAVAAKAEDTQDAGDDRVAGRLVAFQMEKAADAIEQSVMRSWRP